jgi:hypothetical protein
LSTLDERHCAKCGKRLRSNNTTDFCTACKQGKKPAVTTGEAAPSELVRQPSMEGRIRARHKEQRKKFDQLCQLIGQDPDELVACFVEEKINAIQDAVRRAMGANPVVRAEVDD